MPTAVPEIERVFQRSALALAEFPARQDERRVLDVGEVVDLRHDACLGVVLRDARVERRRPFRKRRVLKRPHRARSEEHDRRAQGAGSETGDRLFDVAANRLVTDGRGDGFQRGDVVVGLRIRRRAPQLVADVLLPLAGDLERERAVSFAPVLWTWGAL